MLNILRGINTRHADKRTITFICVHSHVRYLRIIMVRHVHVCRLHTRIKTVRNGFATTLHETYLISFFQRLFEPRIDGYVKSSPPLLPRKITV